MQRKKISIQKIIDITLEKRQIGIFFGIALFLCAAMMAPSLAAELNGAGVSQAVPSIGRGESTFAPSSETPAAGDKVLLYCGNDGNCGEGLTTLTDFYVGMGVTVDNLTSLPADLSVYRLIFIIMPHTAFSSAQISALDAFVHSGARLVLLSDYYNWYSGHTVLNDLLRSLGVPIQVDANTGVDSGCEQFTSDITPDQITQGVTSFEYGLTDTVTVSPPAKVLVRTASTSEPMVAVGQPPGVLPRPGADVVVAGDSNSFTDLCDPDNGTFWKNLYEFQWWPFVYNRVFERTRSESIVSLLRGYRKQVLMADPLGADLVSQLYEKHSETLAELLLNNLGLALRGTRMIKRKLPAIAKTLEGRGKVEMSQLELAQVQNLLGDMAEVAGFELKAFIESVQETLEDEKALAGFGIAVKGRGIRRAPGLKKGNLATTWADIKRSH